MSNDLNNELTTDGYQYVTSSSPTGKNKRYEDYIFFGVIMVGIIGSIVAIDNKQHNRKLW